MASYSYGALTIRVTADTKQLSVDISDAATKAGTNAAGNIGGAMTSGLRAAGGLAKSLGSSVATGLTVATGAATAFGVESFRTAARVGEMDASLRALAKANGLSYDEMQKSVAAIRIKRKEAPQIAPSTASSSGLSHAATVFSAPLATSMVR